ncbi:alkaline shock response membrane anchor protein AmaP [Peptococcus simiae]|uniref:Alkaline shock response membrane anchor protein AmaP n=1 Tax=Peptococcus simiae TaxID=1643805 RepID=A0ABW9GZK0_9FIRM
MRRATKILSFFLGLFVVLYVAGTFYGIYRFMFLNRYWAQGLGLTDNMFYAGFYVTCALAAITALVGLFLMLKGLFARRRDRKLTFNHDDGSVEVSEEAISGAVQSTLAGYDGIQESEVQMDIKDGREPSIRAKVNCGIRHGANLDQYGQAIKDRISREITTLTGLPVEDVQVSFYEADPADAKNR